MSAKLVEITQRMPKSSSAQGACSRDEPQPKLSPATRISRLAIGGLVQHEIGDFLPVLRVAHLVEQVLAQTRPLDRLQELLGDDHVGVDVDQRHGAAMPVRVVNLSMFSVLTPFSHHLAHIGQVPVIAAAAAMAGDIRCVRPPRP
jgi:hypothetical protein